MLLNDYSVSEYAAISFFRVNNLYSCVKEFLRINSY